MQFSVVRRELPPYWIKNNGVLHFATNITISEPACFDSSFPLNREEMGSCPLFLSPLPPSCSQTNTQTRNDCSPSKARTSFLRCPRGILIQEVFSLYSSHWFRKAGP